jgi:hypothetical protein
MKTLLAIPCLLALLLGCNHQDSEKTRELYMLTGKKQCENNGLTLSQSKSYLLDAGVPVLASKCAVIAGVVLVAGCGFDGVDIHVHTVPATDVSRAENVGFTQVSILSKGYDVYDCPVE